jgi:hypothetical protein
MFFKVRTLQGFQPRRSIAEKPGVENPMNKKIIIITLVLLAAGFNVWAQDSAEKLSKTDSSESTHSETSTEEVAKAVQNPVANLISVPFQNNFNFGVGPNDVCQYVLNFQPVIPIKLNEDWNALTPKQMGADWQLRFQVQFLFPK